MPNFIPIYSDRISGQENIFQSYLKLPDSTTEKEEDTVFIFPGNTGHHTNLHQNIYTLKSGGGLGIPAGQLGQRGLGVLSLPTTGMSSLPQDKQLQIAKTAIEDIWFAIGAGFSIALPVRSKATFKNHFFPESLFSSDFGAFEPSFWGENETQANLVLAKYYLDRLNEIRLHLDMQGLFEPPKEFSDAFNQGKIADRNNRDTFYFQPYTNLQQKKTADQPTEPAKPAETPVMPELGKPAASNSTTDNIHSYAYLKVLHDDLHAFLTYLDRQQPNFTTNHTAELRKLAQSIEPLTEYLGEALESRSNISEQLSTLRNSLRAVREIHDLPSPAVNILDRLLASINRFIHRLTDNSNFHFFEATRQRVDCANAEVTFNHFLTTN